MNLIGKVIKKLWAVKKRFLEEHYIVLTFAAIIGFCIFYIVENDLLEKIAVDIKPGKWHIIAVAAIIGAVMSVSDTVFEKLVNSEFKLKLKNLLGIWFIITKTITGSYFFLTIVSKMK